jgi:hypothetical protein
MRVNPYLAARICAASYADERDTGAGALPRLVWAYSTTEYVEMRERGDILYIAFRGSDDRVDWIRNAESNLTTVEGGRVHAGFLRGFNDLLPSIESQLSERSYSAIAIVGHSRGGALAHLCMDYIKRHHPGVESCCITFGCPNLCNYSFRQSMSRQIITNYIAGRWMFLRDPVPHVPIAQMRPGKDIVIPCWGRPRKLHAIEKYLQLLSE